jgi:basic amino acid/polyamine antiporter, APA family
LGTEKSVLPVAAPVQRELVKELGLTSTIALVMGNMIGSGIFIVSADISRKVDSPALLVGAWLSTGLIAVGGALSYGELAAMIPQAGGQYVYLRESLGPMYGFLYGWTLFLVIQTGTIAAVGVAFGKFLGVLLPSISSANWLIHIAHVPSITLGSMVLGNMDVGLNTQNSVAILVVILLTFVNLFGVKMGAAVQNVFTFPKAAVLLTLVALGLFVGRNAQALTANFGSNFWRNAGLHALHPTTIGVGGPVVLVGSLTILAIAQVGSLFSSDAWNNVTFTAAEVRNPQRTLPLALGIGTAAVIVLYVFANFGYLSVLPLAGDPHGTTVLARGIQYASEDRVATAVMEQMFGVAGAKIMAIAILASCFGAVNGFILAGARVYYAMAKDGLFFPSAAAVHSKYHTPVYSLVIQCLWSCLLCISGSYGQLLDYIIFAVLMFYVFTIAGLFVLRVKRPDKYRPYRVIGYPVLPALILLIAAFMDITLLRFKPQFTWPGLIVVLLGVPVYFLSKRNMQLRAARAG